MSEILLPVFSSRIFMVSGLTFKSLIHFEFILVCGLRRWSSVIFLHVSVSFFQHHLLNKLSLTHCMCLLLIPVRMAIINKSINNKCWWGCGERIPLLHCCWECRLVQPLWKTAWRYLKKIKNGSVFWPSNLTSGNISEGTHNTNSKEHKSPYVHCSVIHNHQDVTAAQMSISRWVDQTTMRHLHNGYYLALKKKKILPFVTVWMDLQNSMLSDISQSEKDKYHLISLICGI